MAETRKKIKAPKRRRKEKNDFLLRYPMLGKIVNFMQQPAFIMAWLWFVISAFIAFVTLNSHLISTSLGFLMISLTAFGCAVLGEVLGRRRWEERAIHRNIRLEKKIGFLEEQVVNQKQEKETIRNNLVRLIEYLSDNGSVKQQRELQNLIHDLGIYQDDGACFSMPPMYHLAV